MSYYKTRYISSLFNIVFLIAIFTLSFSQNRIISYSDGSPVSYVLVKSTSGKSCISDEDGFFEIEFYEKDTLYFSRIGFRDTFVLANHFDTSNVVIMHRIYYPEVLITSKTKLKWENKKGRFSNGWGFNTNVIVCKYIKNSENREGLVKKIKIKFPNSFPVEKYRKLKNGKYEFYEVKNKKEVEDSCYFSINFSSDSIDILGSSILTNPIIVPIKYLRKKNYTLDLSGYNIIFPKDGLCVVLFFDCFSGDLETGYTLSLKADYKNEFSDYFVSFNRKKKPLFSNPHYYYGNLAIFIKVLY